MAEKKAIIILASEADLAASGPGLEKLRKKAAVFTDYSPDGPVDQGLESPAVRLQAGEVEGAVEQGLAVGLIDLGDGDSGELDKTLETVLEAIDRKTTLAVATNTTLALYGSGINGKAGAIARPATSKDIAPTLAYITDAAISVACVGAILYQALKSPNLKRDEIGKLREALARMEGALARDNREPWDKHACA
jgi:hypothetical protein